LSKNGHKTRVAGAELRGAASNRSYEIPDPPDLRSLSSARAIRHALQNVEQTRCSKNQLPIVETRLELDDWTVVAMAYGVLASLFAIFFYLRPDGR
jgi:hypothetical protein